MNSTTQKTQKILVALLGINQVLWVVYGLITIGLGAFAYYKNNVLKQIDLASNSQSLYDSVKSSLKTYTPTFHAPKLELYFFWGLVGAIAYIAFWIVLNIFTDIRNDLLASSKSYSHPESFNRTRYWSSIILRELLRVVAFLGLIIYIIVWLKKIAPNLIIVFEKFINSLVDLHSIVYLLYFVLASFVSLHVITILVRLILQKFINEGEKTYNELK